MSTCLLNLYLIQVTSSKRKVINKQTLVFESSQACRVIWSTFNSKYTAKERERERESERERERERERENNNNNNKTNITKKKQKKSGHI